MKCAKRINVDSEIDIMIKINLDSAQKRKIEEKINGFVSNRDIPNKIIELSDFLRRIDYNSTADMFVEIVSSPGNYLFTLFGRASLENLAEQFEAAINSDAIKLGIDVKEIKSCILNGSKPDKVHGFLNFYNSFSNSQEAYDILGIIKADVCPYCNRQYTFTARKGGTKSRPQFDHFFPKSLYPYLAFSVYNLVPSCALCNSGKWNLRPDNLLYPYEDSFEDRNIKFEIDDLLPYLLEFTENVEVSLEGKPEYYNIIEEYYRSFKTKILYEGHSDYIEELVQKKFIFSEDTIRSLCDAYPMIFGSKDYLLQLIFGRYDSDSLLSRPLSKLTRDIMDQMN